MNTQTLQIKDLGKVITGKTPSTSNSSFFDGQFPFVTPSDITFDNYYCRKTETTVTEAAKQKNRNQFIPPDSVLVTCIGSTIGKCALSFEECLTNQQINSIVPFDAYDPKYVYYLMIYNIEIIRSIGLSGGVAAPIINKTSFEKIKIKVLPKNSRDKIGDILSSYDDLIDTNRRRIQLLEESARLLFREWFVYFRFPGHEKAKIIKDGISKTPEGWGKEKVINVVKRVAPGELYDQATAEPIGIVPILDQGQSGIIGYHNNEPSVIASLDNPVIVFANHTCNQRIIHFPFSAIQNIFPFLPSDENYRNIYWLHYATDNLIQLNAYKGHWPEFMAKNILLPPEDLCDEFGNIISMIHKQIFYLSILNQKLAQARDLLLPRLMSGAIEV